MPTIIIDKEEINIPNKNFNILAGDIPDSYYGKALKQVRSFRRSMDYKPGQTMEEMFDELIDKEREGNIEKLAEKGEKAVDEKYAGRLAEVEAKLREGVNKHYEEKAKELQNNNIFALRGNFKGKWGLSPEMAKKNIFSELLDKDYAKTKSKEFQDTFLDKVSKGLMGFSLEELNKDPKLAGRVEELSGQAKAVLDFFSTQKEMMSKGFIDRYVKQTAADDIDKIYDKSKAESKDYKQLMDEISAAKENARKEAEIQVDKEKNLDTPIKDAKEVYLQERQNNRQEFIDAIAKRNELVGRYQSTNIFSRIARWVLPNNWSDAGKIQNEIDKLDKAVKDAGYDKNDVENAQREIRGEEPIVENKTAEKKTEDVSVDQEETLNLQEAVGRDTSSKKLENSEQVVQAQKEEVRQIQ